MLESKEDLSREQALLLLEDFAKRWLAHDGLWFQSIERERGIDEAMHHDTEAWRSFTVIEAKRIRELLELPSQGGLDALAKALQFRLYAFVNKQQLLRPNSNTLIFQMTDCRVQSARERKKMPYFPCKPVGEVEYSLFASTIDARIKTRCLSCPPERTTDECYCAWEFAIDESSTG